MASSSVSNNDIASISSTLPSAFHDLSKNVKSNVQCHHSSILTQLSRIEEFILSSDNDEEIGKRCDALLDAGVVKLIVKLLHSTKNSTIIDNCFQLTNNLTCLASQPHCVTSDHVCMRLN